MPTENTAAENALPPITPPQITPKKHTHKTFKNLPYAEQLIIVKRTLENSTNNPQISGPLARYGYDRVKLALFRSLYDQAQIAMNSQIREHGDSVESYGAFKKLFDVAKTEFSILRKVVRISFKNDQTKLVTASVNIEKKQTVSGLLDQMEHSYKNILADADILNKISGFGLTEEVVKGYYTNFTLANEAYVEYFREDSESLLATRLRDDKMDALAEFMSDFFVMSKIAFADQPELLNQIS